MKKIFFRILLVSLFLGLTSFQYHKFYVSIYQIDFAPEKQMLQITSRIFIDDLNTVLEKKYGKKTFIGEKSESSADIELMKKYFTAHFSINVNGKAMPIQFLSKELDNNVVVSYLKISGVKKISGLKIRNNMLLELNSDQQNIIQTNIAGNKRSFIFTQDYFLETITVR